MCVARGHLWAKIVVLSYDTSGMLDELERTSPVVLSAVYSACDKTTVVVLEEACRIAIMSCSSAVIERAHTHSRDNLGGEVSLQTVSCTGLLVCHNNLGNSLEVRLTLKILLCVPSLLARNDIS